MAAPEPGGVVAAPERVYPFIVLDKGPIRGELRETALRWIRGFEPLDFEAGRLAKLSLETNLSAEILPFRTYFVFSDVNEEELFAFFMLDEINVHVAPFDIPIMQVRHAIEDPNADTHPATKLVWIARSKASPAGLGSELFDEALLVATEAGSCALMVDAHDEATAENLWIRHYGLRKPRDGAADWSCLWHATGEPDQTFS